MATVVNFHGKNYYEPGAYAATVYNPTSVTNVAEFGNVLIIDTGLSKNGNFEFSGGSGVNGELSKGLKSVYEFTAYEDFLNFIGGGMIGDVAEKIFTPAAGVNGAPKVYYARAATTRSAKITLTFGDATLVLKCKNEGVCGNGVKTAGASGGAEKLRVGYSAEVIQGEATNTFKLRVLKGSYMGVDKDGEPYGSKKVEDAEPGVLAESEDFKTLEELYNWALRNKYMLAHFEVSHTGELSTELKKLTEVLSEGGTTEWLSGTEVSDILEAVSELNITFFLGTNANANDGEGVKATTNALIFNHIKKNARFGGILFVAGGEGDSDLFGERNSSESIARYYDSANVVVVHGAPEVPRKDRNGSKKLPSIYLTAATLGMAAGQQPQTPLTFKRVGYQTFVYDLKKKEREKALQLGIMHLRNVGGYWVVNQGVTTLQDNNKTIADDGQSFELSIELIKHQLNKELIVEGEARFTGMTAAQASPVAVKNFTETKLASLMATAGADNLIVSWKNVKVSAKNGDYFITYDFTPNVPVNKTFFIGNILDFKF